MNDFDRVMNIIEHDDRLILSVDVIDRRFLLDVDTVPSIIGFNKQDFNTLISRLRDVIAANPIPNLRFRPWELIAPTEALRERIKHRLLTARSGVTPKQKKLTKKAQLTRLAKESCLPSYLGKLMLNEIILFDESDLFHEKNAILLTRAKLLKLI